MRFAHALWNERLQGFICDAGQRSREERPDDGCAVIDHSAGLVEEPRNQSVFDEMDVLDHINEHIAGGHELRVQHRAADREHKGGVSPHPVFAD